MLKINVMAAGVTDRLLEMVDVIDVLDAFEAKRKRQPRVTFEIEEWKIGGGWYVRVTLPDGTSERIEDFATEGEPGRWIRNESSVWPHERTRNEKIILASDPRLSGQRESH